jgi:hypothetical protein
MTRATTEWAGAPVLIDWARLLYVTENEETSSKEKQLDAVLGAFFRAKGPPRKRGRAVPAQISSADEAV